MSKQKTYSHVHRYQKVTYESGKSVLKCMHEGGCPHFLPVIEQGLGRQCVCWDCGGIMVLNIENIKMTRPKCMPCREARVAKIVATSGLPTLTLEEDE